MESEYTKLQDIARWYDWKYGTNAFIAVWAFKTGLLTLEQSLLDPLINLPEDVITFAK